MTTTEHGVPKVRERTLRPDGQRRLAAEGDAGRHLAGRPQGARTRITTDTASALFALAPDAVVERRVMDDGGAG